MTTLVYTHRSSLRHETPPGHPERIDRIKAVFSVLESPHFQAAERREAPRATADPLLQRLAGPLWLATGALALLFVALAQWQGRGITRAVQRLTSATHAVRSGDFDHAEVDIPRRDELGLLARSFNGMVDMLRQRQRERTGGRR
jgi:HAMP domain-containing protein